METRKQLDIFYLSDRDILSLNILPHRSAQTGITDYGFQICYDWDNHEEIVGFEILDFSYFIPHLYEPGVVPEVKMRFDVQDSDLTNVTLHEVLEWAYRRYILCKEEPAVTVSLPGVE